MPTTVSSGGVNSSRHVEPSCRQLCIISKCLKTASVTASFNQCELLHRGGGAVSFSPGGEARSTLLFQTAPRGPVCFRSHVAELGPLQLGVLSSESLDFPLRVGRGLCEGNRVNVPLCAPRPSSVLKPCGLTPGPPEAGPPERVLTLMFLVSAICTRMRSSQLTGKRLRDFPL